MQEYKSSIKITSVLSLQLHLKPEVVKRNTKAFFSVTAPKAKSYEWKIGTAEPEITENNEFSTSFPTSGTFPVVVKVTNDDGDTNIATRQIYVMDDDKPFSVMDIRTDSYVSLDQKSVCS